MEIDNQDEVEIHISPVGEFYGSSRDGSPVKEVISQQSLEMIANEINSSNEEILVDVDHQSCKVGTEKNSRAFGWVKNLWTSAKGLFGRMKLTPYGKDLVVGREYRFLSPTFSLNDKGEPVKLHSIAATNTPNFDLEPILNSKPESEEIENMSKEDLKKMILEIMNECKNDESVVNETPIEKPVEEPTVETKETVETPVETPVEETVETPVETPVEEPKVETPVEEPVEKTEVKTEKEEIKEEEKEEVIKIEALNTTPTIVPDMRPEWQDLHGEAFFEYLRKHHV